MDKEKVELLRNKANNIIKEFQEGMNAIIEESNGIIHFSGEIPYNSQSYVYNPLYISLETKEIMKAFNCNELKIHAFVFWHLINDINQEK